jgi:hypothetical protein
MHLSTGVRSGDETEEEEELPKLSPNSPLVELSLQMPGHTHTHTHTHTHKSSMAFSVSTW